MSAPPHHTFAAPQTAGAFCAPRRRAETERKAISRPRVKRGGGVVPTEVTSLVDVAYWLTDVEGFRCEPTRKSIRRALSAYIEFRVETEKEYLRNGGGPA